MYFIVSTSAAPKKKKNQSEVDIKSRTTGQ